MNLQCCFPLHRHPYWGILGRRMSQLAARCRFPQGRPSLPAVFEQILSSRLDRTETVDRDMGVWLFFAGVKANELGSVRR